MGILLGLAAALGWGTSDFLARFSVRAIGPRGAILFGQMPGLLLLGAWTLADRPGLTRAASAPALAWIVAILCAPLNLTATYALFRGISSGKLSLVSPLCASYGAVTAILSAASGERLGEMVGAGIGVSVLGVALAASAPGGHRGGHRGVGWALLAALLYGVTFWLQGWLAVPALGGILPVWLYYLAGLLILGGWAFWRGNLALPPPRIRPVVLGGGLLGALAYAACSVGFATGQVAVVTVLSSLSSAVTAVLGAAFLGERLAPRQWAGIAAILLGIALINLR